MGLAAYYAPDERLPIVTSTSHHTPLRILHISEVTWGGVVSLLRHFVAEQSHNGHEVHVLSPDSMPALKGSSQHRWRLRRSRPWTVLPALIDLRREVRAVSPDVVHLHSFVAGFLARLPVAQALWGRDVAVVYQPHAWSFDLYKLRVFGYLLRRWEAWSSTRTDVLVANCDDEVQEGREIGVHTPAQALGVAVDLTRFHPLPAGEREALRQSLGIDGRNAVLCLGRLAHQKGQDLLLEAWERSRPDETSLFLVGPGSSESLKPLALTQWGVTVHAVGERDDVDAWLVACDVLVLPSRYETVAIVVAEALASGTPVVATAVNGARETVLDGPLPPGGAVVNLGDMNALVREVGKRLRDSELHGAESRAGRLRAEAQFDPVAVDARLEAAYAQAIRLHGSQKSSG